MFVVEILSLSAILMLVALPLAALGCSDDADGFVSSDVETTSQSVTSSCTPPAGYDDCIEIDLNQLEYWQDTLPNPSWRTVTPVHDPDVDYEVIINTDKLNGGIIPTQSGQGIYPTWDDFYQTKNALLGVDVKNDNFNLIVVGTTTKLNENGWAVQSTGVFLYDALSSGSSTIEVDNQDISQDYFNPQRFHQVDHEPQGQQATSGTLDMDSNASSMNTSSSMWDWKDILHDSVTLADGPWTADLEMYRRDADYGGPDLVVPGRVLLQISNINKMVREKNRLFSCSWLWDHQEAVAERHCPTADFQDVVLEVANPYHDLVGPDSPVTNAPAIEITSQKYSPTQSDREACGFGLVYFDFAEDYYDNDFVFTNGASPDPSYCPELFN